MRMLMVAAPMIGHVFPLVPLARAVQDAGHDVLIATGGDGLRAGESGVPVANIDPGIRFGRIALGMLLRHPRIALRELDGRAGTDGVALLFGEVNARLADPVVELARQWRPDLIVHEPLALAGAVAAAVVGVPAVLQENILFNGPDLVRVVRPRLGAVLRRHGVTRPLAHAATLRNLPPRLTAAPPPGPVWPIRPVPYGGDGDLPDWLTAPPADGRPRILVTRSTLEGPGNQGLVGAAVAAAADVDAEFVLVRPPERITRRPLPPNVRTVGWVPVPAVLPHCAAVVHHSGAGTTLAALDAGVPQALVTGAGDRRHNARFVADLGAGVAVPARELTAAVLTGLITDGGYAAAAATVRAELAAMPEPATLVAKLESLAG